MISDRAVILGASAACAAQRLMPGGDWRAALEVTSRQANHQEALDAVCMSF